MTQPGGPAAINGFLFQILKHLDWLTDVRLRGAVDGEEVKDGSLILEPRTGGDAQAHASGLFLAYPFGQAVETRKGEGSERPLRAEIGRLHAPISAARRTISRLGRTDTSWQSNTRPGP